MARCGDDRTDRVARRGVSGEYRDAETGARQGRVTLVRGRAVDPIAGAASADLARMEAAPMSTTHRITARPPNGTPSARVDRDTSVIESFVRDAAHFPGGHADGVAR